MSRINTFPPGRLAPDEEPELNNERDIPTEAGDGPAPEVPEESVAGEEDPGAALDALQGRP